jgi:hypothetical protein
MANTLDLLRTGAIGFIDWLDGQRRLYGASVLPLILSNFAAGTKNSRSSAINSLSDRELEIFSFIGRG